MSTDTQKPNTKKPDVLVISRGDLFKNDKYFNGYNSSFAYDISNAFFMNRDNAERDPYYKQIIPYCVIHAPLTDEFLCYKRHTTGAEERLHGKLSIGIGGHINEIDFQGTKITKKIVEQAVLREVIEEVEFPLETSASTKLDISPYGFINYDAYDDIHQKYKVAVGQVHFGAVYRITVTPDIIHNLKPNEEDLIDCKIVNIDFLIEHYDCCETWTKLLVEMFAHYLGKFSLVSTY